MRRRELLGLLGGAAFIRPLSAPAQAAIPTLGFLNSSVAIRAKLAAYYEGLGIEGFFRNQNLTIEYHSAGGNYDRLPSLATDLVKREVALIAAAGMPAALAAKAATTTIPVVFAADSDPVQVGLVTSLNRPGGNITGVTNTAKRREQRRLELLHELIPVATRFGLLVNPANPDAEMQTQDVLAAARKIGVQITILHASSENDFDRAFSVLAKSQARGLVIGDDELFISRSVQLAALAVQRAVPAVFEHRDFVAAGGLMSYGSDLTETYHQAGVYSGLVLKGDKSADLPVYQSNKVELIVNLRAAASLGLTIPPTVLASAIQVFQ